MAEHGGSSGRTTLGSPWWTLNARGLHNGEPFDSIYVQLEHVKYHIKWRNGDDWILGEWDSCDEDRVVEELKKWA